MEMESNTTRTEEADSKVVVAESNPLLLPDLHSSSKHWEICHIVL